MEVRTKRDSLEKRLLIAVAAMTLAACATTQATNEPSSIAAAAAIGPDTLDLVVAATTDVHGRIRSWDYYTNQVERVRGLSRAATVVDSLRSAHSGHVILLDAGDLLQGNPFAYIVQQTQSRQPNAIIAAMNAMRYDAAAIGNHEFNYGVPYLDSAIAQARFPFLSANTYRPSGAHAYPPWTMLVREGIKIGVVGATTPGVMIWDAGNIRGRLSLGDIVPAVSRAVEEVKTLGADVVIVSVHSGLDEPSSYDTTSTGVPSENVAARIASEVPGIDLLLYGHSHKEMREKTIGGTLLVQPKNWATSVSVSHLHLARVAGKWRVASKSGELIQAAGHEESSAILALSDATHQQTLAHFNTPIGTTTVAWRGDSSRLKDTPILDFVLETERRATGADLASSAAFATEAVLGPGQVTGAQIARLYPYDNTLRVIRITGRQLRDYLDFSSRYYTGRLTASGQPETNPQIPSYNFDIVSGVDYTIDLTKPIGLRITRLEFKGRPVTEADTFTFALSNYRQGGGGGYSMLSGAPLLKEIPTIVPELLIEEVKRRRELRPADFYTPNWTLVLPPPAAAH